MNALEDKSSTQDKLMNALKARIQKYKDTKNAEVD